MRFTKLEGDGIIIVLCLLIIFTLFFFYGKNVAPQEDAVWYLETGQTYRNNHQVTEALPYFNEAIRIRPNYAEAYAARCGTLWALGNYENALSDCNRSLQINENLLEAYLSRCLILSDLGRFEDALADCNYAITLEPSSDAAFNNRGIAYYKHNDYELALLDFNQAIALSLSNANAYMNRGFARLSLGMNSEAIADFEKAIDLDNQFVAAYTALASLYQRTGDTENAFRIVDLMIERLPLNPSAYYTRATLYVFENRFAEAEADFLQSLELNAGFKDAYLELGYIYLNQGIENAALDNFCQFLAHDGEASDELQTSMSNLGQCSAAE